MGSVSPSTILCRYFLAGKCSREGCRFAHDNNAIAHSVCRYYLEDKCFFGENCKYDHVNYEDLDDYHYWLWNQQNIPEAGEPAANSGNLPLTAAASQTQALSTAGESSRAQHRSRSPVTPRNAKRPKKSDKAAERAQRSGTDISNIVKPKRPPMCSYGISGCCKLLDCTFRHGEECDICHCQVLDPLDEEQRKNHIAECTIAFEQQMNHAFQVKNSEETQCSVCLEIVLKQTDETRRRFGILEKCKHAFCFDCIMNWRKQNRNAVEMTKEALRSCPACRTHSDYAIPTFMWPETDEQKTAIISEFKTKMKKKDCKHFKKGVGKCPFGNKCWYKHVDEDGQEVQLPPPRTRRLMDEDVMIVMNINTELDDDDAYLDEDEYHVHWMKRKSMLSTFKLWHRKYLMQIIGIYFSEPHITKF